MITLYSMPLYDTVYSCYFQFVSPAQGAGPPAAQRILPAGPMSVADAMAVRSSSAALHPHPATIMSPAMQVEAHRAALQAAPHVPISAPMDRVYLNQRMMGSDRADLAALYNNPAFIARQQQYPAAAMHAQAMFDMQNWQQQMRRDQSFERESAERQTKVSEIFTCVFTVKLLFRAPVRIIYY